MARKNDLAKLAALAGLGMVITEQYRNKVDLTEKKDSKVPTNFGDLVNPYPAKEEPRRKITDYISKAPSDDSRTDAASSGDEMSKYAASYKPQTASVKSNPVKPLKSDVVTNSDLPKAIAPNRSPGDEMSAYAKGYKNLGTLVNPYPKGSNEAAKQAAIEATKKHAEAQKAVMAERLRNQKAQQDLGYGQPLKRGGAVKKMASGGMTSSASRRGDGIATKGKTRGKIC